MDGAGYLNFKINFFMFPVKLSINEQFPRIHE